ncbi:MAG: metal-dependent transcriptional regulator [Candidatus Lokiarchaeota archaeon]|nr:metal-dependent transcriptional regulator [Candidatus Lokiarchaeota archaeon]
MLEVEYSIIRSLNRSKTPMKVGQIASLMDKPHSTIGSCVKKLQKYGYIEYQRYSDVRLSLKGRNLAVELERHARLLEILLCNALDMTPQEAHEESKKFNLLLSCSIVNKICEKYDHPKFCPCGEEIKNSSNCYCEHLNK